MNSLRNRIVLFNRRDLHLTVRLKFSNLERMIGESPFRRMGVSQTAQMACKKDIDETTT